LKYPPSASSEVNYSEYGFSEDIMQLSCRTKNLRQCMISSMHHCIGDDPETGRLEIVNFYNLTKYGVYSLEVSRYTRKWLKAIFCMV
jgi:hypothetical protein